MLAFALFSALDAASAQEAVSFDIPSQPLARALFAYSAATGIEVMVDARQVAGWQAPGVKGVMPPRQALSMLLVESGLVAREFGPGTVTLASITRAATPAIDDQRYFADVQRAIEGALCADTRTAPGTYRLALKLWVGPSGKVMQARRLDTTGDLGRDNALDDVLPRVSIGKSPPPHFAQPVALLISPGRAGSVTPCTAAALAPHRDAVR